MTDIQQTMISEMQTLVSTQHEVITTLEKANRRLWLLITFMGVTMIFHYFWAH